MFGTIYNSYKNRPAETLGAYKDYKDVIESAFKQPNFKILVEDVHCIPEYKSVFDIIHLIT
jgi:hypothetical protein